MHAAVGGKAVTMPHERTRAIGWGKEMLASIQEDNSIPEALRARAREIDPGYPTAPALRDWLAAGKSGLTSDWAASISSAHQLFQDVQRPVVGSETTRRELTATLRHFPDPWTIKCMANSGEAIARWLSPADRY